LSRLTGRLGRLSFAAIFVALALLISDVISRERFDIVFALAFSTATAPFLYKTGLSDRKAIGVTAVLIIIILIAAKLVPDIQFAPYLAVVLINAVVAYVFFRNQLPERTPLILQLVDLIDIAPIGSQKFQRFIYWQCWAWVAFGGITSAFGLVAMLAPDTRPFTGTAITGLVTAQLGWFFLSHGYANWRHKRPETWRDTVRAMARPTIWNELNI
jgi:hypothetical protein